MHNPAGLSPIVAGAWRLADWQWTPQQRLAWIEGNADIGVTSFDHADSGGGQTTQGLFGEALALRPALRSRLQLVSQCGIGLAAPAHPGQQAAQVATVAALLRASVDRALQALQTDHLDLLLIHQPETLRSSDAPDDTWADTLADLLAGLRRAGKVRHFGASNFAPQQLAPLHSRLPLATHQIALSPLQRSALHDGVLDQCQHLGLRPMAWSPLAGGRIFTGQDDATCRLRAMLQALADARGISITTLVIAWVLHHPSRPLPILGSRRIGVAQEALAALPLRLDVSAWRQILVAASGGGVP